MLGWPGVQGPHRYWPRHPGLAREEPQSLQPRARTHAPQHRVSQTSQGARAESPIRTYMGIWRCVRGEGTTFSEERHCDVTSCYPPVGSGIHRCRRRAHACAGREAQSRWRESATGEEGRVARCRNVQAGPLNLRSTTSECTLLISTNAPRK